MSTDLETLLREAAEGPVPHLDLAEVRRRGRRRRRTVRAAGASGVGAVAGVIALGLAFVPGFAPTAPVIESPGVATSPQDRLLPLPDPMFAIGYDEGGCALQKLEDGEVVIRAPLDDARGAVWCADRASSEAVRDVPPVLFQAFQTVESPGPATTSGVVGGTIRTIEVVLHDGSRIDGPTFRVETPGDVDLAGFAIQLPEREEWLDVPMVDRVVGLDHRGEVVLDVTLDRDVHEPLWDRQETIDRSLGEQYPAAPSSAVPVDDLPLVVPDLPLVGGWRPERSPLALTSLSFHGESTEWHLDRWHVAWTTRRAVPRRWRTGSARPNV